MQNKEVFNEDNMIEDNFDKKNLRPIKSYEKLDDNDTIGDLASGKLYHEALSYYVDSKEKPADVDVVYGFPIVVFTDEANHDTKGGNKSNPLAWCSALLKEEVRRKLASWKLARAATQETMIMIGRRGERRENERSKRQTSQNLRHKTIRFFTKQCYPPLRSVVMEVGCVASTMASKFFGCHFFLRLSVMPRSIVP